MYEVNGLRIALCDDELLFRKQLTEFIEEYAAKHAEREIRLNVFDSGEALIDAFHREGCFDVCILDIVMPGMNGIQLGAELRRIGCDSRIIYLTSSTEYAIASYSVKAHNYILKPLRKDEFTAVLDDVLTSVSRHKEKSLIVKTNDSSVKLSLDNILCAQLNRRVISYFLKDGRTVNSIQIRTSFAEAVQELLCDSRFALCGASIAVNLHHITMIEKDAVVFLDRIRMFIPRKACAPVRTAWYDYWFEGEGSK